LLNSLSTTTLHAAKSPKAGLLIASTYRMRRAVL
jgi:hypothetical protein